MIQQEPNSKTLTSQVSARDGNTSFDCGASQPNEHQDSRQIHSAPYNTTKEIRESTVPLNKNTGNQLEGDVCNVPHQKSCKETEKEIVSGDTIPGIQENPTVKKFDHYNCGLETRWRPERDGSVSLCIYRKKGYREKDFIASLDDYLPEFHRDRAFTSISRHQVYNLCNDRFLTGTKSAETLDVIKSPRNRRSLPDTPDGTFRGDFAQYHGCQIDHLDRTCMPLHEEHEILLNLKRKRQVLNCGNQRHIYAENGFLIGDEELNVDSTTLNGHSNAKLHRQPGRARIIAPWAGTSSFFF